MPVSKQCVWGTGYLLAALALDHIHLSVHFELFGGFYWAGFSSVHIDKDKHSQIKSLRFQCNWTFIHAQHSGMFSALMCSKRHQILRIRRGGAAVRGRKWRINSAVYITWFCVQDPDTHGSYYHKLSWHLCLCLLYSLLFHRDIFVFF